MTWKRVCKTINHIFRRLRGDKWVSGLVIGYPEFGKHLNETGRPIVYSCSWPAYWGDRLPDYPLIQKTCNLWRNYGDIQDTFGDVLDIVDHYGDHEADFVPILQDQETGMILTWYGILSNELRLLYRPHHCPSSEIPNEGDSFKL